MPIGIKIAVDTSGIDGLVKATRHRAITLKAVRAGARVLRDAAKARAPRRTGALKASQGIKAAKGSRTKTGSYAVQGARTAYQKNARVGRGKKPQRVVPAFYDHLVQGGTKPHRTGKGERLARAARGKKPAIDATGQTSGRMHPGARPNPYRREAYQAKADEIGRTMTEVMGRELQKEIDRQAARLAAKAVR